MRTSKPYSDNSSKNTKPTKKHKNLQKPYNLRHNNKSLMQRVAAPPYNCQMNRLKTKNKKQKFLYMTSQVKTQQTIAES
jgi:hypothetical protein